MKLGVKLWHTQLFISPKGANWTSEHGSYFILTQPGLAFCWVSFWVFFNISKAFDRFCKTWQFSLSCVLEVLMTLLQCYRRWNNTYIQNIRNWTSPSTLVSSHEQSLWFHAGLGVALCQDRFSLDNGKISSWTQGPLLGAWHRFFHILWPLL